MRVTCTCTRGAICVFIKGNGSATTCESPVLGFMGGPGGRIVKAQQGLFRGSRVMRLSVVDCFLQMRSFMGSRSAKLDVAMTNGRNGIFALESIAKDEILIDLNGEDTLSSPTKRSLQIGEGKHVFGREETVGYLNHGCEPNAFLDFSCLCVRALKDIRAGEEVKINYAATEYEMHDSFRCDCGSPICLRMIRGFKFLTRGEQLKLRPYLAPYLLRRLDGEA